MAFIMSFCTTFGIFKPSTTKEASYYRNDNIKNVIYLIGDGMGFNHLEKAKLERDTTLVMDSFEFIGQSMTRSFTNAVTDSASGGTALATGTRTYNGAIGVYPLDGTATFSQPKNLTELCMEEGMMTGVITTDETSGATPASFSAHSSDRGNTEDITNDQLTSGIDLIWGTANGVATKSAAEANGFTYVTTDDEMMALEEGSRSFAQFTNDLWTLEPSDENTPNLEQMAVKAVDLLDDTDEGFFLMIEGAHIDKHSHSNEDENMTEALIEFDRTIAAMLEYAEEDGEYKFTSGSHSAANVPVLVYGSDKIIADGEILNNYEIPIRIAFTLGFDEEDFPFETKLR